MLMQGSANSQAVGGGGCAGGQQPHCDSGPVGQVLPSCSKQRMPAGSAYENVVIQSSPLNLLVVAFVQPAATN